MIDFNKSMYLIDIKYIIELVYEHNIDDDYYYHYKCSMQMFIFFNPLKTKFFLSPTLGI